MTPQTPGPKAWWAPRDWGEEQALRVIQEVHRLRKPRSAQWLADQTKELGYEVTRSVIADLENGRRRYVTIAELLILAKALGVEPLSLLFPGDPEDVVEMLPDQWVPTLQAKAEFGGDISAITRESAGLIEQLSRIERATASFTSEGSFGGTVKAVQPKADDAG